MFHEQIKGEELTFLETSLVGAIKCIYHNVDGTLQVLLANGALCQQDLDEFRTGMQGCLTAVSKAEEHPLAAHLHPQELENIRFALGPVEIPRIVVDPPPHKREIH